MSPVLLLAVACSSTTPTGSASSDETGEETPEDSGGAAAPEDATAEDGQGSGGGDELDWGTEVGSYLGIVAFSNGPTHDVNGPYETYGYQYQCVEYVNRFLVQALGYRNLRGSGNAKDYWTADLGLERGANADGCPVAGDVLVSTHGDYGHVAVVREVGEDDVTVIQQNWDNNSGDGAFRLSMERSGDNCYLHPFGDGRYTVAGWLHVPGAEVAASCTGEIDLASVEGSTLEVVVSAECEAGIGRVSLVVDDTTVYTVEPGGTSASVSTSIALSPFGFESGDHTLGLWARDALGAGDEVALDSATVTLAEAAASCGDGSLDAGEECDGRDLDDATCASLGYAGGDLACDDRCWYDASGCCSGHASVTCDGSGDLYWADSCGQREDRYAACPEGCDSDGCLVYASDETSVPTDCETDGSVHRNILTASAVSVSDATGSPSVAVTWEKCDGSGFSSSRTCNVRVGSYASSGVTRELSTGSDSFTWSSGRTSATTTFDAWTSGSPFASAACGETKEFYVTCDDDTGGTAWWYSGDPVVIAKECP